MKPKILVLCSYGYERDRRQFLRPQVQKKYEVIFEPSSRLWLQTLGGPDAKSAAERVAEKAIDTICEQVEQAGIDAVVSTTDYPTNIMRTAIQERLKKAGPSVPAILLTEHKYYARLNQRCSVPEVVPFFCLARELRERRFAFPLVIKPVKSNFGKNTFVALGKKDLAACLQAALLPASFLVLFNYFLKKYTSVQYDACNLLIEGFLQGRQATVEGFVYNGEVVVLGVVDSLLFPGTISFARFEYPSCLEPAIQERMKQISTKAIAATGLDNTFFNVECIYDPTSEQIIIVEINPRISSQFADLFERVDGMNTYETLIELALGRRPCIQRGNGPFGIAASCVLRFFEDKRVERIPSQDDIKKMQACVPDAYVEVYARPGKKLSDERQDGKSFRYGLIHVGASNRQELLAQFQLCKQILDFRFKSI